MSWEKVLKFDFAGDMDGTAADMDRENFDMIDPNTGMASKENILRFVGIVDKTINKLVELENMMQDEQSYDFYNTNEIKQLSNILSKAIALLESRPLRR
tara:strand:- start:310 stop:606 length:297 start_codon:yes stop_codon:yes gene_type:complete